jgi:hypothetical protein
MRLEGACTGGCSGDGRGGRGRQWRNGPGWSGRLLTMVSSVAQVPDGWHGGMRRVELSAEQMRAVVKRRSVTREMAMASGEEKSSEALPR